MAYGESRLAAHSGSPKALQGEIGHESKLHAPDADKLAGFRHKLLRIKDEIDYPRTRQVSEV